MIRSRDPHRWKNVKRNISELWGEAEHTAAGAWHKTAREAEKMRHRDDDIFYEEAGFNGGDGSRLHYESEIRERDPSD